MNIPRLKPVDTSVVQRMRNYKNNSDQPIAEKIRRVVKSIYGYDPLQKKGSRDGELVQARQYFVAMMVRHTRFTYENIADYIGKDHSTITHIMKTVHNLRETDKYYDKIYKEINDKIKSL